MSEEAVSGIGSLFEEFLKEESIYGEMTAQAVKRVRVWQMEQARRTETIQK